LPKLADPNLIVGFESADDAGVYKLTDDLAIIQTVDFFTPIVDDPFTFGQIAAANSLSDVYAMGGKPLTAMNLVCFPIKTMGLEILREMLRGGLEKLVEAKTVLVGGHSIEDPELKYGLSITGVVRPDQVLTNAGARPGDSLVLTKPLGTGIINTAMKAALASPEAIEKVTASMRRLNEAASLAAREVGVHGITDITGFGLLGHAGEMARASGVSMQIEAAAVPFFPEAKEYAARGLIPGGTYRNRQFCQAWVDFDPELSSFYADIFFDPQTSGGLLISVLGSKVEVLLKALKEKGVETVAIVGEVTAEPAGKILVR